MKKLLVVILTILPILLFSEQRTVKPVILEKLDRKVEKKDEGNLRSLMKEGLSSKKIDVKNDKKEKYLSGQLHIRFNYFNDKKDSDKKTFRMETNASLSLQKRIEENLFKATIGYLRLISPEAKSTYVPLTSVFSKDKGFRYFALTEVFYQRDFLNNMLQYRMGRFHHRFSSHHFFNPGNSYDGINFRGTFKGFTLNVLGSILQPNEVINDKHQNFTFLENTTLAYKYKGISAELNYTYLHNGKDNIDSFTKLKEDNHYLHLSASYKLDLNSRSLIFNLAGSYNLNADDDNFGISTSILYKSLYFNSKAGFVYKQAQSVIGLLALQDGYFKANVVGGNFNLTYNINKQMNISADVLLGKAINGEDDDLYYTIRIGHNFMF